MPATAKLPFACIMSLSLSKPFSQCSLSDLAPAISADATTASARALDPTTVDRLLPVLRNDALTAAVLLCHPLVRDHSGLKCDGSACSRRAWCDMLRDLADAAGVDVSDAALLRVYFVCKECAKHGRVQLCSSPLASDCAAAEHGGPLAAPPASVSVAVRRRRMRCGALAAPPAPAPAAAPRSASSAVAPPLTSAARRRGSPLTFKYHDRFLDKAMHIPIVWLHQIVAPLMLVSPALHFARSRAAAGAAPQHPAPPVGCMIVQLWPAQRTRFMFGFTLKACDRASTAPASSHMFFRTASRWRTRILQRVMAGYVCKVEVRWLLRSSARCLLF
jgi:hypothetical protein